MEGMRKRVMALAVAARDLSSGSTAVQQPSPGKRPNPAQRAFAQLADCLEGLALFLSRLADSGEIQAQQLEEELSSEENLLQGYKGRSSLYLLMCSPKIMAELQESGKRLRRGIEALGGTAKVDSSLLELLSEGFRPTGDDEALIDSLEEGMLDTIVIDTALCRRLARQIAEGVGMEMTSQGFVDEVEKLWCERSAAEARGGKVHALYLEQFLLVLDRALRSSRGDAIEGDEDCEREQAKRMKQLMASLSISGRDAPMLPLQPFICPITRDVMRDPVQIASGQTYEREAIERWFAEGNTRCPVMGEELPTTQMKSNFALKQSIAEWRERNFEARLHCAARCLLGEPRCSDTDVRTMRDVRAVCEEEPLNKYKVGTIGLIGPMVKLLHDARDAVILRKEALAALAVLARDNVENQESMVKAGIVEQLVFSLTRQKEDLGEAVLVMKILSENPSTAELISHAQGAVVFLVTLLGCEDEDVNSNVTAILENVPSSDENVVIMAEANLMRPLANRLVEGSMESRILMANALAAMHLPDSSKTSLATEDVLVSLLKMIESFRREENEAALGALQNLTSVPGIAETVLTLHGFRLMEHKLTSVKSVEEIKVGAARILADLSKIAGDAWSDEDEATMNQLEIYIYEFLQFMGSPTAAGVQSHVLSTLLGLANGKNIGGFTRAKLCEHRALQTLLPLLKNPATSTPGSAASKTPAMVVEVRRHAMELFCLLSKESSQEASAAMREEPGIIAELVKNLSEDPERTSMLGIIASMEGNGVVRSALDHHHQDGDKGLLHVVAALVMDASQDAATTEAAVGIVLKFAKLGVETQKKLAEAGMIERLVQLLEPGRSMLTRRRAARCLAEFSSSSWSLSESRSKQKRRKQDESCRSVVYLCLPWLAPRGPSRCCRVHGGECTARHTFCLVEADAVVPLVALLKDAVKADAADTAGGAAAALAALATLTGVLDEDTADGTSEAYPAGTVEGCHAIDKAKGLSAVIAAVSSGGRDAQRYALAIVERLFSHPDYCAQYGPSAQMHVIYAAQTADPKTRRAAGLILRRLELIHSQSNYFGASHGL
ncbi:U-box domain-containing protein 43 [Selaginella moellendorffii]|uniref:U-box domain-containing protein 43 n=1 Tax=Selaginella moellendorffii TaxID=88036 RepID=UPI000D1CBDF1|nr:U-box domain-containing protein 43 [Selaginella moellendorffii]|eukprot:XP_002987443.2 U-box domain-containing protein 43 [Selaginella moellendorffii]